jgi:hypothetical protein
MRATCTNFDTMFNKIGRQKDGTAETPVRNCLDDLCAPCRWSTGCNDQFSCVCEACQKHCCSGHLVLLFDMRLCPGCLPQAWAQIPEPDCQCTQTDVDVFSVRDCEIHNLSSEWNELRRAFRESEEDGEMKLRTTKRR